MTGCGQERQRSDDSADKAAAGYTLFELLVVVAILAVMTTLLIPYVPSGARQANLQRASAVLAADLRLTRSRAIVLNKSQTLMLDVGTRRYETMDGRVEQLPEEWQLVLVTADSEVISDRAAAVRFFSDGSSTGGRINLRLGGQSYWVKINWLTGQISVDQES